MLMVAPVPALEHPSKPQRLVADLAVDGATKDAAMVTMAS